MKNSYTVKIDDKPYKSGLTKTQAPPLQKDYGQKGILPRYGKNKNERTNGGGKPPFFFLPLTIRKIFFLRNLWKREKIAL